MSDDSVAEPKSDAGIMVGEVMDQGLVMVQIRNGENAMAIFIKPDQSAELRRRLERAEIIITCAGPAPELKKDD